MRKGQLERLLTGPHLIQMKIAINVHDAIDPGRNNVVATTVRDHDLVVCSNAGKQRFPLVLILTHVKLCLGFIVARDKMRA